MFSFFLTSRLDEENEQFHISSASASQNSAEFPMRRLDIETCPRKSNVLP
jgi:hypothetical protein